MKPVLVDTSVWRHYFSGNPQTRGLGDLLDEDGVVLVHPFVIGELVLGGLSIRQEDLFGRLPSAKVVSHDEVLGMVRRRRLMMRGIGWVDAHLLASALISSARLWSLDRDLAAVAAASSADFHPTSSSS